MNQMRSMISTLKCAAAAALCGLGLISHAARAQDCGPQWLAGQGAPGFNAASYASVVWDPDGQGPRGPMLVVGGAFTEAGGIPANHIAALDLATKQWSTLGSGLNGDVYALAVAANGNLLVGGAFTAAGGVTTSRFATWNGSAWTSLGNGFNNSVGAVLPLPDGDIVVGGSFTSVVGGPAANRIARWHDGGWSPLGSGIEGSPSASVNSLARLDSGDIVAGGTFATAGGVPASNIARWDGTHWSPLGAGTNDTVTALQVLPNGTLAVGGAFNSAGAMTAYRVAAWDGAAWTSLGSGLSGSVVTELALLPNGDLIAGGNYNTTLCLLSRWNGTNWTNVPGGVGGRTSFNTYAYLGALCVLPESNLFVGGTFTGAGTLPARNGAIFDGNTWLPAGAGIAGRQTTELPVGTYVYTALWATAALPNGDVVAGGMFVGAGGQVVNNVARWNGSAWQPLGSGTNGEVQAVLALPNGDIIAAGEFTTAGGVPANHIARWDGSAWSPMGGGILGSGQALALASNGDILASGPYTPISRWDGFTWSTLGPEPLSGVVALAIAQNGDILAAGGFQTIAGVAVNGIARWNGSTWSPLGPGRSGIFSIDVLPNGNVIAGGIRSQGVDSADVALWDGSTWTTLSNGFAGPQSALSQIYAVRALPTGDIVAAGIFDTAGGVPAHNIALWNGNSWSALGAGITGYLPPNPILIPYVNSVTLLPSGDLAVGGYFDSAGGFPSASFARYSFTGIPAASRSPLSTNASVGSTITLSATPVSGYRGVSAQWYRNGAPISDGPGGASPGGGVVSGASLSLASPTDASPAVLVISGFAPSDAGDYTVTFTNACGSVTSDVAVVGVAPTCDPDVNRDGVADQGDVDYLINVIAGGANPTGIDADFNADGVADQGDVDAIVNVIAGGPCP